jgi:hypothetical protein
METFGSRPEEATTACLSDVDACDIFIGIYAHRYGFIPEASSLSITELEFDHAREKGKPILAFIVDPDYQWPEDRIEAEPEKNRLRAFHDKIQTSLVRDLFSTPEDLAVRVATSLSRFLQQSRGTTPDVKELTTVLELRKNTVIRMMEDAKQRALKSFRSGLGRRSKFVTEEELVAHLDSMKSLFLDLHRQNVTALIQGQLLVSHELISQIHTLLWIRERNTFWSAHASPLADYAVYFSSEEQIARIYPEEPFGDIHPKQETHRWGFPGSGSIAAIETELLTRDQLNAQSQREREEVRVRALRERIEQERRDLLEIDTTRGIMKARLRSDGWTQCPFCNKTFSTVSGWSWNGERHTSCNTRLELV